MGDNDKNQRVLTQVAIATERFERYKNDPEAFVEKSELVIAVKTSPKGLMAYISSKVTGDQIMLGQAKLNRHIDKVLTMMEMQHLKKQQGANAIIAPGGHKKTSGAFGGARF